MELSEIKYLAEEGVHEPWGLDHPWLQNSESQPAYYRFLYHFVRFYKPALVVECGVYMGTGAGHMAFGNPGTKVIGIDVNPHTRAYTAMLKFDNFFLVCEDTTDGVAFAEVSKYGLPISLIFLDSEHDGITAIQEYNLYKPLFADECLVVCDDILDPRMEIFWTRLPGEKAQLDFLHPAQYPGFPEPGFGVSIVRKNDSKIEYHHTA